MTQYNSVQTFYGKILAVVVLLAGCPSPRPPESPPRRRTPAPDVRSPRRFVPPEAYRQFLMAELAGMGLGARPSQTNFFLIDVQGERTRPGSRAPPWGSGAGEFLATSRGSPAGVALHAGAIAHQGEVAA